MSTLSSPQQNRNICDETDIKVEGQKETVDSRKCLLRSDVDDGLIDQRLVELQELLGTYSYGISVSCLFWLEKGYRQKFNRSLDYKSLGVNNIKELLVKMGDKGMVVLFEEPESKKKHVMSARMVEIRQNVLKLNVQELLDSYHGEIEFNSFEDLYEDQFKVKLNYFHYGLKNLDHVCKVLKDILVVEEANPSGAKVIKAVKCYNLRKRKNTNMSTLSSPQQNQNICDEIEIRVEGRKETVNSKKCLPRSDADDGLIDQRLGELQELLGTYYYGIPMSRLSWLEIGYLQKFKRLLDYKSLGVNNIKELLDKMGDKGMVVFFEEPESKKKHVMSARMVEYRQNVFLKLNVQKLLDTYRGEIEFNSFEDFYEDQFKVKLYYFQYGLKNLDHLCKVLKDILVVEEANPSGAKVIKSKCYNSRKRMK